MELILLQKVQNLGDLGDKVQVRPGYGRNYLVPQGKAVPATKENVALFEARRAELEEAAAKRLSRAESRREQLENITLEISANASDEGKLYGSVGPREITMALEERGIEIEKSEVAMGDGPIQEVGEYDVLVQLHADVELEIKVVVTPEDELA